MKITIDSLNSEDVRQALDLLNRLTGVSDTCMTIKKPEIDSEALKEMVGGLPDAVPEVTPPTPTTEAFEASPDNRVFPLTSIRATESGGRLGLFSVADPPAFTPPSPVPYEVAPLGEDTSVFPPGVMGGPELDSEGVVWNAEIHAGTKSKMKNGAWTPRRRRKSKVSTPLTSGPDYLAVVKLVSKCIAAQTLSPTDLEGVCLTVGIKSLTGLLERPELLETFYDLINNRFNDGNDPLPSGGVV